MAKHLFRFKIAGMKTGFFIALCAVAALSACKQELTYQGKPVDPMCFMAMEPDVDLQECTGTAETSEFGKTRAGLEIQPDGTRGYFFESEGAYVMYRYLGKLKNGHDIVRVDMGGGGTGNFNDVREVEIKNNRLTSSNQYGGDRCNGALEDASVQNGVLRYSRNITPFDLVELSDGNQAGFKAYEDIEACAICCVGTAGYEGDQLVSVSIGPALGKEEMQGDDPLSMCFYDAYNEAVVNSKVTLNTDALKAFGVKFNERCGKLKK